MALHSKNASALLLMFFLAGFVPSAIPALEPWSPAIIFDDQSYVVRGWELSADESALFAVHGQDLRLAKFDLVGAQALDSGTTNVLHLGFPEAQPDGVFFRQDGNALIASRAADFADLWSAPLSGFYNECEDYGACLFYGEVATGRHVAVVQTAPLGTFRIYSLSDGTLLSEVPIPAEPMGNGTEKIHTAQRLLGVGWSDTYCLLSADWSRLEASSWQMAVLANGEAPAWPFFHIEDRFVNVRNIAHNKWHAHLAIPAGDNPSWPQSDPIDADHRILIHRSHWNGVQVHAIEDFDSPITAIAYTADGRHLLAATGDLISVYDVQNDYALVHPPVPLPTNGKIIHNLAATNDLSRLFTRTGGGVYDGVVTVWAPASP